MRLAAAVSASTTPTRRPGVWIVNEVTPTYVTRPLTMPVASALAVAGRQAARIAVLASSPASSRGRGPRDTTARRGRWARARVEVAGEGVGGGGGGRAGRVGHGLRAEGWAGAGREAGQRQSSERAFGGRLPGRAPREGYRRPPADPAR